MNSQDDGTADGSRLPRLPVEIEPLVRRVAAATNVPPFAPEVFASLFRAIAAEVHDRGFSLNRTVNGVIHRLSDQGMKLRPQSVAFVVKGLMLSGHEFVPSDTPGTLAKVFRRQVLYLAANADLVLADQERSIVGAWILGALRSVPPSEATSYDEVATDPSRAAEAAGVSIEETIHAMDAEASAASGGPEPPAMTVLPDIADARPGNGSADDADGGDDGGDGRDEALAAPHPETSETPSPRVQRNIDDLLARIRSPSRS